jgi:hypothetical protein
VKALEMSAFTCIWPAQRTARSVVATLVAVDDPPGEVMVTTAGISRSLPD